MKLSNVIDEAWWLWRGPLAAGSVSEYVRQRFSHLAGRPATRNIARLRLKDSSTVAIRRGTSDFHVFRELYGLGQYDRLIAALPDLPPNPQVLDLGANIGLFATSFLRQHGGTIFCVEPDAENFAMLEENLADWGDSARVLRAFAGGSEGEGWIRDAGEGHWGYQLSRIPQAGPCVPVISGSGLLELAGWESADLVKCDIEGSEAELFGNGSGWMARVANLVIEIHRPYTVERLMADLSADGSRWEIRATAPSGEHEMCAVRRQRGEGRPA